MGHDVDVLIVGAGISGIDAAYHLQTTCPNKSYAILEARDTLGGTWDLFRYPGIRSDSDMYTLGFPFRPWTNGMAIADGDSILEYIRETAEAYGIDRHIRYRHRVEAASWHDGRWHLEVTADGVAHTMSCKFLFLCSGYYDYDEGYTPELAGRERFRGAVIHPQHWPEDLDYAGTRIVVIGSGATAVTLVPELAKRAAHVTMLQRSPTYIMSRPARDPIADWLRKRLSTEQAYSLTRWKNVLLGALFYTYSRRFPEHAKKLLVGGVKRMVPNVDVEKHFTPRYNPWDQRLCLVPDADLFAALREGTVSVVTDEIDSFTETGIALKSGEQLEADIIVTATGLKLRRFGGLALTVDGTPVEIPKAMVYKGMMLSDVPNLAFAVGYTNASWTLKCDLTSRYVCRLVNHLDKHGFTEARPRRDPNMAEVPLLDFTSGYVQRAIKEFPRQGAKVPWKLYQNYPLDLFLIERSKLADGVLQFT
ncbi:MAG TPA: NAD(P)/FAD-dependent oxidoreductase [Kofleriaceae bacterium]